MSEVVHTETGRRLTCACQVSCGAFHSLVLTNFGKVFAFGNNSKGQLGIGPTVGPVREPRLVGSLQHEKICGISSGYEHSFFISLSRVLFSCGNNSFGQLGLNCDEERKFLPEKVVSKKKRKIHHMSGGGYHSLFTSKKGKLFSVGRGSEGQLGVLDQKDRNEVVWVKYFKGNPIMQIAAGYYHSVVASVSGEIFSFGENSKGQLGLGDFKDRTVPSKIGFFSGLTSKICHISAGSAHTAFVDVEGNSYATGDNSLGQLGLGENVKSLNVPEKVFVGEKVASVKCANYHTFYQSEGGRLYSVGRNSYHQLGLGVGINVVYKPMLLTGNFGKLFDFSGGLEHSVFAEISEEDRGKNLFYSVGRNSKGQCGQGEQLRANSLSIISSLKGILTELEFAVYRNDKEKKMKKLIERVQTLQNRLEKKPSEKDGEEKEVEPIVSDPEEEDMVVEEEEEKGRQLREEVGRLRGELSQARRALKSQGDFEILSKQYDEKISDMKKEYEVKMGSQVESGERKDEVYRDINVQLLKVKGELEEALMENLDLRGKLEEQSAEVDGSMIVSEDEIFQKFVSLVNYFDDDVDEQLKCVKIFKERIEKFVLDITKKEQLVRKDKVKRNLEVVDERLKKRVLEIDSLKETMQNYENEKSGEIKKLKNVVETL